MVLNRYGQKIKTINGTFFVGQRVVANQGKYRGLKGTITEIRTGEGTHVRVAFRKLEDADDLPDVGIVSVSSIQPDRSRVTCPDCGAQLVPGSGCFYCPWCGFSYCK
ncbi:hypothetical protein SAMN02746089_02512 [Caldanaerobius fijiensis DSM 17918]|uniref:KOW domain-containing protein n=1 Tax=Caldanaerobius fijiensis DSM 17918 TaxID=1121256 RepID=A0A1M5EAS3_9THEO|nr:hypothetical protein SAMN02746089_02512 [Caldanaerobius fijiensis DSM 17918]